MTKNLIIILLLLLILSSCTVTKRLYRKGFNVEWHKNYVKNNSTNQKKNNELAQIKLNDEVDSYPKVIDSIIHNEFTTDNLLNIEKNEVIDEALPDSEVELQNEIPLLNQIIDNYNNSQSGVEPFLPFSSEEETKVAEEDSLNGMLAVLAGIFLVLGILLIVASLFVLFGFPSVNGLFSSLVFSGNGFIAGVLGFLLFLLILVVIILFVLLIEFVLGYLLGLILGISLVLAGIVLLIISK